MLEVRKDIALTVTDGFFRCRERKGQRVGIVVRDGEVKSGRTFSRNCTRIPFLRRWRCLGRQVPNLCLRRPQRPGVYRHGGADTWAFGPALVREGEVPRYFCSRDYRSYREIRCALA